VAYNAFWTMTDDELAEFKAELEHEIAGDHQLTPEFKAQAEHDLELVIAQLAEREELRAPATGREYPNVPAYEWPDGYELEP
jgi:hypothetical protein